MDSDFDESPAFSTLFSRLPKVIDHQYVLIDEFRFPTEAIINWEPSHQVMLFTRHIQDIVLLTSPPPDPSISIPFLIK